MRWGFVFALGLGLPPALADGVSTPGVPHSIGMTGLQGPAVKYAPGPGGGGPTYSGPGDVISGAALFVGLRAYNAAYAAALGKSVNVRRASDNVTCDFNVAATGGFGVSASGCSAGAGLTLAAFATQDATASCTIATTTATCTSATSTPNVGSTITGAGVSQPCWVVSTTISGGAGNVTLAGGLGVGSTPCGTVGSATTLTFTRGLYATKLYDQSGTLSCTSAACDLAQATAAKQYQLLPSCLNALPCLFSTVAGTQQLQSAANQNVVPAIFTLSDVMARTGSAGLIQRMLGNVSGGAASYFNNTANTVVMQQGINVSLTVADNVWHAMQFSYAASAASFASIDGVNSSPTTAGTASLSGFVIGIGTNTFYLNGYIAEAGVWGSAFTSGQTASMCHNQFIYWGTPTSC